MVDWSQFMPVEPGGATGAPAPPSGGVDWSQFQPVDMPADNRAAGVQAERSVPMDQQNQYFTDAVRQRVQDMNASVPMKALMKVDAGMRGAADMLTFGYADEIAGALDKLTGRAPNAQEGIDRQRATDAADEALSPGFRLGGQLAGAVALPGAAMRSGAGMAANMGRGAVVGGLQGAAYGSGSGVGTEDRLQQAATGAALGAGVGAAAPPVLAAIGAIGRGVGAAASPVVNMVRGAVSPEAEAARRVAGALERDGRAGGSTLTAQEFQAADNVGQPVVNLERGGETTRALARSAANTSPEGRAALEGTVAGRSETQSERVGHFVDGLFPGGANAVRDVENLQNAARSANRPAYARAYQAGRNGVWDEELAQLSESPAMQAAIRDAIPRARNDAALRGFDQPINPFQTAADGTVSLRVGQNGERMIPNLQFWDSVQRSLRNMAESARGQRALEDASTFDQLRTRLNGRLDQLVPEFGEARAGAARFFGAQDALEAGRNFVMSTARNEEAAREIARFSPQERELFARGFAHDLVARVNEIGNNRNAVISKVFGSNASRQRLNIALGPERARQIEAFLRVEMAMQQSAQAIRGNSTTARQLVEAGLAGGAVGGYQGGDPTSALTGALIGAATRRGVQRIDERVARRVAEMLSSNDPQVFQRGVRTVANNERLMNAFRNISSAEVQAGGRLYTPEVANTFFGPAQSVAGQEQQNPQRP